jgi:hypothetical protein
MDAIAEAISRLIDEHNIEIATFLRRLLSENSLYCILRSRPGGRFLFRVPSFGGV